MAHGDYQYWQSHYRRVVVDLDGIGAPAATAHSPFHQLFIQKITNGGTAAVTVSDADPANVALDIVLAEVPAGEEVDFGPTGTAVRIGFQVESDAPTAGRLHIEGYQKISAAMPLGNNNL